LLDHNELHEAKLWLTRWQNLHPDESETAEFQAEVDIADKKFDHAVAVITKQTQKPATPSGKPWAADLLDRLAFKCQDPEGAKVLKEAAERAFRDAAKQAPRQTLALSDFLARQGRISEAVDLCSDYANKSPEKAGDALLFAVGAVCQPQASSVDRARVEQLVRQHMDQDNHQPHLATAMGTLYEAQTRYGDAVNAYRQAIELNPNDIVALNNIALLLAHQGNTQQANAYLKQAVQIAGPRSDLLDSRGTVRLAMGDADGAIADFTSAIADKASPSRWLHLAAAQLHAHHNDEAQKAFDQALTLGLNPKQVHPFDQSDYGMLNNQFGH
jgi:tetratricopeptide (TPR) repeat protein